MVERALRVQKSHCLLFQFGRNQKFLQQSGKYLMSGGGSLTDMHTSRLNTASSCSQRSFLPTWDEIRTENHRHVSGLNDQTSACSWCYQLQVMNSIIFFRRGWRKTQTWVIQMEIISERNACKLWNYSSTPQIFNTLQIELQLQSKLFKLIISAAFTVKCRLL